MTSTGVIEQLNRKTCGLCCTKLKNFGVTVGGKRIIHDIDIHIHCGELTALIGPNGAGKTTLLKAILGEIRYTGELLFLDAGNCRRNPIVGYVPQKIDFDVSAPISVLDLFAASMSTWPVFLGYSRRFREDVATSLVGVKAEHLLDRRLGELSGGELQRVLLAMALNPNPDLLLLDEPISGIDVRGRELFYDLVSNLRQNYDMSIILVSHDWSLMSQYADRIVFLDGTVQFCGKPNEVFSNENLLRYCGPVLVESINQDRSKSQTFSRYGDLIR